MNPIRLIAARFVALATLRIASFLDRGVDGLIDQFAVFEDRLSRFITKQEAVVDRTARAASDSFARVDAFKAAEQVVRDTAYQVEDAAMASITRARRIRQRIADLLD